MTRYEQMGAASTSAPDSANPMSLRVTEIRYLAESIREIKLAHPDGRPLPAASPGAHIDLSLPGDISRSYSLVNGPGAAADYTIAVNRDRASRGGSAYMCETLRVGEMLPVSAPINTFPLAPIGPRVFIAGGIGITPILSMIRALVSENQNWELHYAVRSAGAAAYLPELQDLASVCGQLHLHDDSLSGTVMDVAACVNGAPTDAHLYCCGPAPMIAAFEAAAEGRNPEYVHVERFTNSFEASQNHFTVVLKRRKLEFEIPAGRTIMDVLMENGIRVAHSCQEGVCGTCETRVLEGEPDHKDGVLSARERASNKVMMICCSGAKSKRLVLDI